MDEIFVFFSILAVSSEMYKTNEQNKIFFKYFLAAKLTYKKIFFSPFFNYLLTNLSIFYFCVSMRIIQNSWYDLEIYICLLVQKQITKLSQIFS